MSDTECTGLNVFTMLFLLALHLLLRTVFKGHRLSVVVGASIVIGTIYALFILNINKLTMAHLMVGALAGEAASRVFYRPIITCNSWGELTTFVLAWLPNALVVLDQTVVGWSQKTHELQFHDSNKFARAAFFRKQHCFLHFTLCVLITSTASSFFTRWRNDKSSQLLRVFLEPACLVAVAMILITHDHQMSGHELQSHPAIGTLMCITAASQFITNVAHLTVTPPTGGEPNLVIPYPGLTGKPLLLVFRLMNTFCYLMLAHFLYIDSVMEYLGCRGVLLKHEGGPDMTELDQKIQAEAMQGLTPTTELSTYMMFTTLSAPIVLAIYMHSASREDAAGGRNAEEHARLMPLISNGTISPDPKNAELHEASEVEEARKSPTGSHHGEA